MAEYFRNNWKLWIALGVILLISVLSVIFLSRPHTKIIYEPDTTDIPGYSPSGYNETVTMIFYKDAMSGRTRKTITGEVAKLLKVKLLTAAETAERAPKLADGEFSATPIDGVPARTVWFEVEDKLYRVNPERTQLCQVETHYGEGKVLRPTANFFEMIQPTLYYWPNNCYSGIYRDGTLTLTHVYKAEPTVDVTVTDLEIGEADEEYQHYTITLRLRSKTYQTVQTRIESGGGCLFYTLDGGYLEMNPGWAKTITMEFQSPINPPVCCATIYVANTRIDLRIEHN